MSPQQCPSIRMQETVPWRRPPEAEGPPVQPWASAAQGGDPFLDWTAGHRGGPPSSPLGLRGDSLQGSTPGPLGAVWGQRGPRTGDAPPLPEPGCPCRARRSGPALAPLAANTCEALSHVSGGASLCPPPPP